LANTSDEPSPDLVEVAALDILSVTVSPNGREMSSIVFSLDVGELLQISFTPELLAKLEGMLAQAAVEQAKQQPRQ
jgi:hypothetical protein